MRRLSAITIVAVLAFGLGACGKHGAKNVYACPNNGPKRRFQDREVGQARGRDVVALSRLVDGEQQGLADRRLRLRAREGSLRAARRSARSASSTCR